MKGKMEEMYLKFVEVLKILHGPEIDQDVDKWPDEERIRAAVEEVNKRWAEKSKEGD